MKLEDIELLTTILDSELDSAEEIELTLLDIVELVFSDDGAELELTGVLLADEELPPPPPPPPQPSNDVPQNNSAKKNLMFTRGTIPFISIHLGCL